MQIASSRPYTIISMDCNMPIMDGCIIYRSNTHRDWETAVVFKLVLYNHKSLKKGRQLFLDSSIRIRAEICVFSQCIYYCALCFLMYVCMYPRTNVLCQIQKRMHAEMLASAFPQVVMYVWLWGSAYVCKHIYITLFAFCMRSDLILKSDRQRRK